MKLVGMMPVRNEDWVLGLSLRVALMWCDEVVVLLHACTDRSEQIVQDVARENPERVTAIAKGGSWDEMVHREAMLVLARGADATHLAIIDADEVITGNLLPDGALHGRIRGAINSMMPESILELPGYNLRNGINQYHNNGVWGNRWFSISFKDAPDLGWSGDRFHHREPGPRKLKSYRLIAQGEGGTMHLWGASERRLIAKHALYKVTERLRWPKKNPDVIDWEYSLAIKGDPLKPPCGTSYGTPATWTYSPVPEVWWEPYAHLMKYLDVGAEPWQEAEVLRLVAEHGRNTFRGLDLFGVA